MISFVLITIAVGPCLDRQGDVGLLAFIVIKVTFNANFFVLDRIKNDGCAGWRKVRSYRAQDGFSIAIEKLSGS